MKQKVLLKIKTFSRPTLLTQVEAQNADNSGKLEGSLAHEVTQGKSNDSCVAGYGQSCSWVPGRFYRILPLPGHKYFELPPGFWTNFKFNRINSVNLTAPHWMKAMAVTPSRKLLNVINRRQRVLEGALSVSIVIYHIY